MSTHRRRRAAWGEAATPLLVAIGLVLTYVYVVRTPARPGDDQILNRAFLAGRLRQHLDLVAGAFVIAATVAVPLGILLADTSPHWHGPVFLIANLGQSLPSIAVLALTFTFVGLGMKTAIGALVLYALLPILRNTLVGIRGVDPAIVEAARGMGLSGRQVMLQVRLPLASPAIFAGLRTALVLIVGTATLANFVGGGGLGDVIAAGITSGRDRIVLTGASMVAAIALLADWGMGLIERSITPRL